jgi:glyoxylase-like metal-dependent hydrolase (beta-lactamase superfamily II)
MTGSGTNTYLVGTNRIAVIDPGPADQSHIDAIINACSGNLQWILVTHTHPDHSPAAAALAAMTGAIVIGNTLASNDGFQDDNFAPQQGFKHNEVLTTDEFNLKALLTPGHVDNHICYLVEEDGLVLTGDHIMQGSTVVIIPPHGDMQDYINSLRLLLDYPIRAIGPGHGLLIDNPVQEIEGLVAHRLGREAKVLDVLSKSLHGTLDSLTPLVYDDVDASLHPIARYSLHAHLIKLKKESLVLSDGDSWILIKPLN